MTTHEEHGKTSKPATARTGSQIGTSIAAGAAIGSVLPVGGTAVGLLVGLGVGLAMSADPDGDSKTFGDNIADGADAVGNFGKRLFGG